MSPERAIPRRPCRWLRRLRVAVWRAWACCLVSGASLAVASDLYVGSICEGAWGDGFVKPIPAEKTRMQREMAERGDAQALYFMGVVTEDVEQSNAWLKRAIDGGSKGAAAYYAYLRDPRLAFHRNPADRSESSYCWWPKKGLSETDEKELLEPIVTAAEAGEPQPATWLWLIAAGRTRYGTQTYHNCDVDHPLVKRSDVPKWMETAAHGGNPWAQEELCTAYLAINYSRMRSPDPDFGFTADPRQAFLWCSIAAHNSCADGALVNLSTVYREGIGIAPSPSLSDYWSRRWYKLARAGTREIRVTRQTTDTAWSVNTK